MTKENTVHTLGEQIIPENRASISTVSEEMSLNEPK